MQKKHLALAIASAFSFVGQSQAQQSGETGASASEGTTTTTTTITVTARRREELLQDVPGAVSAFSGEALAKAGVPDIVGLTEMLPSTTLKTSRATNTTLTAFIRGVGQQDPVAGYEQGVGIYLDDIYLARPQGAVMDIYDVERIEVLRGPQGTLYGRNTIGGAVKYVTKRLGAKPQLDVTLSAGSYGQADAVVKGSTPVSDTLRIGGTVASFNRDGFGKNVVNGKDNYDKQVAAGRLSLEWTPSPNLFVRLAADRSTDDSNPKSGFRLQTGLGGEPVLKGDYDTRAGLYTVLGHEQQVKTHGSSMLVEWTVSDTLAFKSITASRGDKSYAPIDFDALQGVLFEAPAVYKNKQFSQEFQLTYTGRRLQGVGGVFYMDANAFNRFDVRIPNAALGGLSLLTEDDIDTKTWAAFADLSYDLTDSIDVTVGGRYTSDRRQARIYKATYIGGAGSPNLGNPNAILLPVPTNPNTNLDKDDLDRTDKKFTPKIGLGWKLAPNHNAYLTYSEGFKGGMFDPRMDLANAPTSPASLAKREGVKPEEVDSLELGLKSRLMGGKLQTNLALFTMDYQNVQIPGSQIYTDAAGNTQFTGTLTNAGKARINGFEFEGLARVSDQFSLSGMYSYLDAEYKEWMVLDPAAKALVNIAHANEFQNTPKHMANLTATYEWPLMLFARAGAVAFSNSLAYKDKTYQFERARVTGYASLDTAAAAATLAQNLALVQEAYTLWNASLVWTSKDRKIEAGLHGRNLGDKRYKVAGYAFGTPATGNSLTTFYGDPRTVTATLKLRF